jgi:hypothetical protein
VSMRCSQHASPTGGAGVTLRQADHSHSIPVPVLFRGPDVGREMPHLPTRLKRTGRRGILHFSATTPFSPRTGKSLRRDHKLLELLDLLRLLHKNQAGAGWAVCPDAALSSSSV